MIFTVFSLRSFGSLSCGTLDRSREITEQLPGSDSEKSLSSLLSFRNECRLSFVHLFLPFTVLLSFGARLTFSKSPMEPKVPMLRYNDLNMLFSNSD